MKFGEIASQKGMRATFNEDGVAIQDES